MAHQDGSRGHRSSGTKRQVLITGAAGFLGRPFAEHLAERGEQVVAFYRNRLPTQHQNILPLCCDMKTVEGTISPLRNIETVVHLAWSGGVLGSPNLREKRPTDAEIQLGENFVTTQNLLHAMERAGTKRIIFISWLGASRKSDRLLLREKYWVENAILNSQVPEKIIIRLGIVVAPTMVQSDFAKAAFQLSKLPIVLPVPRQFQSVFFTSSRDLFTTLDGVLRRDVSAGANLFDVTSTEAMTGESVLSAMDDKWWHGKRLKLRGMLGDNLYRWTESNFGRIEPGCARLSDYLVLSERKKALEPRPLELQEKANSVLLHDVL